ncbi:beta strand repeat-containing protein [Cerasicoccus fimbriatus]|uniref:beta strand repeat-containing protein n=1 Tax=Cerasicoccus fimbriatus TaxID=3014554 RepID=UPI0022B2DEE7|nr:PEP-CTERM sorting domain-containing protein [Cerasicoccus sp. TK19100]
MIPAWLLATDPYLASGFKVTLDTSTTPPNITATGSVSGTVTQPSYIQAIESLEFQQVTLSSNSTLASFTDSTDASTAKGYFIGLLSQDYSLTFDNHGDLSYSISTSPSNLENSFLQSLGAVSAGQQLLSPPDQDGASLAVTVNHYGSIKLDSTLNEYALETEGYQPVVSGLVVYSATYADGLAPSEVKVTTYEGSDIQVTSTGEEATGGITAGSFFNASTNNQAQTNNPVEVVHGGSITADVNFGAGISASSTGAPFSSSDAYTAVGNDVHVTVSDTGKIAVNTQDNTQSNIGVGVLAVSDGFVPETAKSDTNITGGAVKVTLEQASEPSDTSSTLQVGNDNTKLGIGVLAISSGSGGGLSLYSESLVSSKGNDGSGGAVTVDSSRAIETKGEMSIGIAALSLGGQNAVTTVSSSSTGIASVGNVDSDFAPGGGDTVKVTLNEGGDITTLGTTAHGVVAISASGGGLVVNEFEQSIQSPDLSSSSGTQLGDASGASSSDKGKGKAGGTIEVVNNATITTGDGTGKGVASIGVVAQSIGGGGGSAGGKHASLFVGGSGDAGGAGGAVGIEQGSKGVVQTNDAHSVGILGQSVGGGGGNGANAEGLFIAIGGKGGEGGEGGNIAADLDGQVTTKGDFASGVILQSVGGGGGHGGNSTAWGKYVSLGIGGSGGKGGTGGDVVAYVDSDATITTAGKDSSGLHLQSIGGGGGTGGTVTSKEDGSTFTIATAIGGSGGVSGDGGDIIAGNAGTIKLTNASGNASALYAQSIGGGGGHGGSTTAKSHDDGGDPEDLNVDMTLSIGGSGGASGHGGDIALENTGNLSVAGDLGVGMFAQSIGGGGGAGGKSSLAASLKDATGDYAQFNLSAGGSGGHGGNGGDVALVNGSITRKEALITTTGHSSIGILGQSVGGGGGHGGSGNVDVDDKDPDDDDGGDSGAATGGDDDEKPQVYQLTMQIGGTGGTSGDGGYVAAENHGVVTTEGDTSSGLTVQSIGGGGGVIRGTDSKLTAKQNTVDITVGANDKGSGGNGGKVEAVNHGLITTTGGDSAGIVAQSIAGGGGDIGKADSHTVLKELESLGKKIINNDNSWNGSINMGSSSSDKTSSGDAYVVNESESNILTTGHRSMGILAQSIGGGGGKAGISSAVSNAAYVDNYDPSTVHNATLHLGLWQDGTSDRESASSDNKGLANVTNEGYVETLGYAAPGVIVQGINGGGGVAANGAVDVNTTMTLGTSAEGTNYGNPIFYTQESGTVITSGDHSIGVLAQSIGLGGGYASTGDIPQTDAKYTGDAFYRKTNAQLGVTYTNQHHDSVVGAGIETQVTLSNGDGDKSTIATAGNWAHGVVSQSIGGGGGVAQSIIGENSTAYEIITAQLGAQIGDGQNIGGPMVLTSGAGTEIVTEGFGSAGIILQSIGAGGGIFTSGSSDYQGADHSDTPTNGYGYNYKDVVLGAGDQSKSGGDQQDIAGAGGSFQMDNAAATITTKGMYAHGVVLQSIGGGGGIFGAGQQDGANTGRKLRVQLGGSTDANLGIGMADQSLSNLNFDIHTSGDQAHGLIVQSISDGGGIAMGENIDDNINNSQLGSNQKGDSDHNAGNVAVSLGADSKIVTEGNQSHGVIVQSIGGGGGIIANVTSTSQFKANTTEFVQKNTHGYSGDVQVDNSGEITVKGTSSVALIAQSISGGGGIFGHTAGSWGGDGSSTGKGGTVLVQNLAGGVIDASASSNGIGIFAQAVAASGNGGQTISVYNEGTINVHTDTGVGVMVSGGNSDNVIPTGTLGATAESANNAVVNHGTITGKTSVHYSGNALVDVHNHGHMQGSLWLSPDNAEAASGSLYNYGLYKAGLDVGGVVINEGDFYIGADHQSGGIQTTFHENFINESTGALYFDILALENHDAMIFLPGNHNQFAGSLIAVMQDGYLPEVDSEFQLIGGNDGHTFEKEFLESLVIQAGFEGLAGELFLKSDNSLWLQITQVPEPETYALLVGLATLGALLYRRRRAE